MRLRTGNAKMLRPELEQVDGFIDNIRYKGLTREGGILSLSGWRNEKSAVQEKDVPRSCSTTLCASARSHTTPTFPLGQRLDETEIGEGTTVTFIDTKRPAS
jgi:hypothetical protein